MLLLFTLFTSVPAGAAGLEDADARLFRVQLSLAEKGDTRAQYYLGEMHEQGLGTKQNIDEAFKWYAKAAEHGDRWAKRKLEHRAEIEADLKKDQNPEILKSAPAVIKPKNSEKAASDSHEIAPVATAQTEKGEIIEKKITVTEEERIKAAEKEKRRARVRALILQHMRNPAPGLFE